MATTPVPAFIAPPDFPALSDRASGTYNSKAFAWAEAMQDTTGPNIHALAVTAKDNADDAASSATLADADRVQTGLDRVATAADRVQTGLDRVQTGLDRTAAADSAVQASKLNLGNKSTPPTLDNQGAALLAGATYYDTTLGKWRVWTGAAWGDGISSIAGVASVNGATGAVTAIATTGANTFTAAQELPTGTAIASAATVNLNTATGNRVHITGTTTITAVTLTRGPRTVIFDSVLTLTHHATNNNLPGAANITTAAGDRAIYESDGITVYCVSYTRSNGAAIVGAGNDAVVVHTGNGHGSTNTMIRRFTTTLSSIGTAITYADSATLGASFTINQDGIYAMTYWDEASASSHIGISLNSSELTTTILNNSIGSILAVMRSVSGSTVLVTRVSKLTTGNVVRPHTDSGFSSTNPTRTVFSIAKVG